MADKPITTGMMPALDNAWPKRKISERARMPRARPFIPQDQIVQPGYQAR